MVISCKKGLHLVFDCRNRNAGADDIETEESFDQSDQGKGNKYDNKTNESSRYHTAGARDSFFVTACCNPADTADN